MTSLQHNKAISQHLQFYKHICSSSSKPAPKIYAQVANFSGDYHFLLMSLCMCIGQVVLIKCQYLKGIVLASPRGLFDSQCFAALIKKRHDNNPSNNLSSPSFHDRAVESFREISGVLFSQI